MKGLLVWILWLAFSGDPAEAGGDYQSVNAPEGCGTGLAFDGKMLWVADRKSDRLYAVDPASGSVRQSLEAPGYWPTGLAFDGKFLWAADRDAKRAYRIDTNTGIAVESLELDLSRPEGLAWDGRRLWCVDGKEAEVVCLDPADGTAVRSFPAPHLNPTGLAFDGSHLWVADRIEDALYRVDPETGRAVMKIPSRGKYPYGLACTPGGLYCADYQSDMLDCINQEGNDKALVTNERQARVEYILDLINQGPGRVETADFYVAVPSDGVNQKLLGEVVFEPEPADYTTDRYGQRFAHFRFEGIAGQERARAVMKCDVELREVLYFLWPEKAGSLDDIPGDIMEMYLADGAKYDLENEAIARTAQEVVGDERNVLLAVQKIYDYVLDHIEYELVGGWNTAAAVLERGTGSCSEYSFCFIALCRAAGIPARYAGSLVIRGDDASFDDVFHRWSEVYLPGYGWIPFDPSRGDKELPADRLKGMGWLANSLFITTRGGGDSEYLGWTYNAEMKWTSSGKCTVKTEQIAEWDKRTWNDSTTSRYRE